MSSFPRDGRVFSTLALLTEGYDFVANRCRRLGSDVFETRLMLHPFISLTIRHTRIPAAPESGFVIRNVRRL